MLDWVVACFDVPSKRLASDRAHRGAPTLAWLAKHDTKKSFPLAGENDKSAQLNAKKLMPGHIGRTSRHSSSLALGFGDAIVQDVTICFLMKEMHEMAKLLSALLFAAALLLGLGAGPAMTYACPMQSAQAEKASSPVQLAMEESDEDSDEGSDDDEGGDEDESE